MTVLDRARPSARSPASPRTALRSGRLRRLLAGHLAAKLGLHLLVLGVGLHVLQQTSLGTWTSVVVALGYAPQALLSGYAGAIADRHARGTVLSWSSSIRGCCGVLAMLAAVQNWPPAVLVAAVAVASVAATPAYPAVAAAAPGCVPDDSLPAANTLVSGVENAGWTAGPGLFGGILLVGGGPLSALAAATVLHGIGTLTACRLTLPAPDAGPGPARPGDLLAATRLVLRAPGLRGPMQLATIGNFLYGYLVVVLVLLGSSTDPEAAGRLNAGLAVGAVASLLVVHRLAGRADATRVLRWSLVAFGMCVLLVGMVRVPTLAVLLVAGAGAGTLIAEIVAVTLLQRTAPPAVHARVIGIYDQLAGVAIGSGSLVAGPLAGWLGPGPGTALTAGLCLVLTAATRCRPLMPATRDRREGTRRHPRRPDGA